MVKAQEWFFYLYDLTAKIFIWGMLAGLIVLMPNDSPAQTKWVLISIISAGLISEIVIREKLGMAAQILFAYVVANAAWFGIYKYNRYQFLCVSDLKTGKCLIDEQGRGMIDAYGQQALKLFTMDGLAKLLLVLVPVLLLLNNREKLLFWGSRLSAAFCGLNVGMVFYALFFQPKWCQLVNSCGGSLSNPSMNSSMIVATMPFLIRHTRGNYRLAGVLLAVIAVFLSKGSIGIGLLCVLAGLYAIKLRMWKLIALAPLPLLIGALQMPISTLLSSGTRLQAWEYLMGKWALNPINYVFGTGFGNFGIFSANLQRISGIFDNNWWIYLHNDWLEILFTLGLVGLVLSLAVYLTALWRVARSGEHTEAIALILFGMVMCVNWPLHHPISAAFGAWIVLGGLLVEKRKCGNCLLAA